MTIFAVLMPTSQPLIVAEIEKSFPDNNLKLNDTQYLISTGGTAIDLSVKLGLFDTKEPARPATGSAVILATSSYFGRAPTSVWEWMKTKLESSSSG
jgi:4-aminobutyrate aminotransferase-like enzyme